MPLPVETDEAATLAVVVARLDDLREDVAQLRTDLANHRNEMVSRGEWLMRNQAVDARFESQGREIAELKTAHASSRAPWWSVAAVGLSALAIAWNILGPVI